MNSAHLNPQPGPTRQSSIFNRSSIRSSKKINSKNESIPYALAPQPPSSHAPKQRSSLPLSFVPRKKLIRKRIQKMNPQTQPAIVPRKKLIRKTNHGPRSTGHRLRSSKKTQPNLF
jgi:hypothetical protein